MSNKKYRTPAGMIPAEEVARRISASMAREHALIALDHLYSARRHAYEARGRIQLLDGAASPNDLILAMTEEAWKVLVTAFMKGGVIKPGDIGRYGIPAQDRQKPTAPGNNGQAVDSPSEDTHGEDQSEAGDPQADQPDAGPEQRPQAPEA